MGVDLRLYDIWFPLFRHIACASESPCTNPGAARPGEVYCGGGHICGPLGARALPGFAAGGL